MLLLNSSAFTGFVIYIVGEQGGGDGGGGDVGEKVCREGFIFLPCNN
jgi:hypothetical protein